MDPTYAWTLAFLPLLVVPLPWVIPELSVGSAALITIGLNCLLAVLDQRRLASAGIKVNVFLALFLVPFYLIARTRKAGSTPAIPVVWFVSFIASFAASSLVGPFEYDVTTVEREIAVGLQQQWGERVDVHCPQDLSEAVVGDSFGCRVVASDGTYEAAVSIDWGGYWGWQIN